VGSDPAVVDIGPHASIGPACAVTEPGVAMFSGKKKQARVESLMTDGGRAVGTITNVLDTGMAINDNPRVDIVFRIDPLDGSASFAAQKRVTVSRVRIPQIGARYPVFYDHSDQSTFAYVDGVADANGRANIVAMFGDAFGADASGIGMPAIAVAAPAAPAVADPLDRLKKLGELHESGVLTDAEFETQKAAILATARGTS
jgi:putative oligomerization/nucleic acid binding protein